MDHPGISQADLRAGGGQHSPEQPLLLSDGAGGKVYGQEDGAGLHFREGHDAEQGGQKRRGPLLYLHGLPQFSDSLCGSRDGERQVLRKVQPGRGDHQPSGRGPVLGKRYREILGDLKREA